jgi:hypothetical protein
MPDPELLQRIRTIFLHPQRHVSIPEAARLLGWSGAALARAIADGELETTTGCAGEAIARDELLAKLRELHPIERLEAALGRDAAKYLPPLLRTRRVTLRLPSYQIAMLEHLAAGLEMTARQFLSLQLDELAGEHVAPLSAAIPGFAGAVVWPQGHEDAGGIRRRVRSQ